MRGGEDHYWSQPGQPPDWAPPSRHSEAYQFHYLAQSLQRLDEEVGHLSQRQASTEARLDRVERLREIIWAALKFLYRDGLKMLAAIVLFGAMFSGGMTVQSLQKLLSTAAGTH